MTHLQFRILIIPHQDENPNTEILQNYVEQCGLYVHSMHRVELERTNGPLRPEILECVFEVLAEDQTIISNKKKAFVYKEFSLKWCQITKEIIGARPILQFCVNECFFRKRMNSHEDIKLQSVSFGIQPRLGHFVEYSSVPHNPRNLIVNFWHDMKEIEVITSVHVHRTVLKYERDTKYFTIKYSHIRNIFVSLDGTKFEMYLDLLYTPLFYQKNFTEDNLFGRKRVNIWRTLYEGDDIKIIGKSNILKLNFLRVENILELLSCFRFRCDKAPVCFVSMSSTVDIPPALPILEFEHFGCAYMWTALTERTYTILEQSDDLRLSCEKLLRYSRENGDCLEEVLTTLLFVVDSGRLVNYWSVIDLLFASYTTHRASDDFKEYSIPRKCRLIRRATLTPTRVLLWPPDLMCENRILRNFDSEYFLRVTFRDDDLLTLNIRKNSTDIFDEAVTKHMNSGLTVGRRRYEMLAWSSSQLREHGVSMYAEDSQGRTAADIRRWTEIDPRTEMNIPKCLSRIGQCFSQTEDTIHVPMDNLHVRFERDIENRSYVFSDGIGKISMDLAAKVRNTFRQPRECSAFQIRYGGCKGMLVVDPTLTDVDIVFRESMRKFECRGISHTKLEIAKRSGPIPLRLNRPLITILNDLGIRKRIFLKLQEAMIQNLTDMLLDEDKAAAYLNARTPISEFKFRRLSQSGIGLTAEPFFRTLLLALHRYYIDLIKTKANIDIDPDFARNMFGVIDETGKLEYGQVFVQYSSDASLGITTPKDTRILKGTVMVTRFPCVHPGDVRQFRAVDVPELHHIIDCIVFPQKGHRPHPDEMAGGDLDGDEFAVIWMKDLFFEGPNHQPGDYPKPSTTLFQNVSDFLAHSRTEEIVEFVVSYIVNDNIGSIASAHLAQADNYGIFSETCLEIAKKHSIAVDFAKTGYSVSLEFSEQPKKYPDFMEKFFKKKYNSKKSLGKMYRVSKDFEMDNEASTFKYHGVQVDPNLVVDGWEKYEESAILSRNEYNNRLRTVIQTYGISHEAEAIGGAFIKLHPRFRERRDRAEIVLLVHSWLKELVENTRRSFFEDNSFSNDVAELNRDIERKASAWYVVTYREKNPDFLSFPWVVSEFLANIRILVSVKLPQSPRIRIPMVLKFEDTVIQIAEAGMLPRLSSDALYALNNLRFNCDRTVIERALSILTIWGNDERIITTVHAEGKYLYYKTYVKLILHVAELEGYVSTGRNIASRNDCFTSAGLCISFFKYCMKLRFLNKPEVREILPFHVINDRVLSKSAIVTFHSIAVTGHFPALSCKENMQKPPEVYEMKSVYIDTSVFGGSPVEENKLREAESILTEYSEVEEIGMRESRQKKKVIVTANGNHFALQKIKHILGKSPEHLSGIFERRIVI